MNIRFFLLGTGKHSSAKRFEAELKQLFTGHLSDDGDISSYDSIKDATTDIAKAVSGAHALVFIADTELYGNTKLMLSKAFGFDMVCDGALLEKACAAYEKDKDTAEQNFSVAHAYNVPNARAFVLDDGLFCGFSVANGNQTIILLPFEKDRTLLLLTSQLIPYLNASYHISIDTGALKKYNAEKLFSTLESRNAKVALAGTKTANFFKEYLSCDERLSEQVSISPLVEKRGNMQPVDYVVNLSITASEFMSCPYGVAMSNAFYTGNSPDGEKIVYLAVTNERETAVREVHSFKGEDIPSFLSRCCGDLCIFISDIISNDGSYTEESCVREKAAAKRYKIAIGSVAALIIALGVFCFSYFYTHGYTFAMWGNNFLEWVFPAGNPFEGMFEGRQPLGNEADSFPAEETGSEESTEITDNEEITSDEQTTYETENEAEAESDAESSSAQAD